MDNLDTKIYDAQSLPKPLISQKPSYFDIKFKDVSFTYEGMKEKALHQLSFECQPTVSQLLLVLQEVVNLRYLI